MTTRNGKHLSFPFRIAPDGRMATHDALEDQIRDELAQLVLTNPGERADLPDFGGGIRLLLFQCADQAMEGLAKARITQSIAAWLGERVTIENLDVVVRDGIVEVTLAYKPAGGGQLRVLQFQRTNPA